LGNLIAGDGFAETLVRQGIELATAAIVTVAIGSVACTAHSTDMIFSPCFSLLAGKG
jgi:hypothetical protein